MHNGYDGGWHDKPAEVLQVIRSLPYGNVSEIMSDIKPTARPTHMYGWDACRKVTGDVLRHWNQKQVGSCVGFGSTKAAAVRACIEIAMGQLEEYKDPCPEVTYAGSKCTIGGDCNMSDGSVGGWAAKFLNTYGLCPRGKYSVDLTSYIESQCRSLAARGLPQDVLDMCKLHPFKSVAQVSKWDDAKNILAKGGTILIASNRGFSMTRDSNGKCQPSGSWSHCMALIGYYEEGGLDIGFIDNSWDENAFSGPIGPGDGPLTGFYADGNVIDRDILGSGDCWALFDFEGFKKDYTLEYLF